MKLNALLKTLGFLALAATPVVAGTAPAPKNPIAPAPVNDDLGITASLGYDSSYIWRGLNFGNHWVRSGLNGSILLMGGASEDNAGNTYLNWDAQYGSLVGDNDHLSPGNPAFGPGFVGNASFQRLELGTAIAHDFGSYTLSLGYRYFANFGDLTNGNNTVFGAGANLGMNDGQEIQLGLRTALGPVNIASSANYDFVNNYYYFDLDLNSVIAVTDSISLVPYFNIGYGKNINWQSNPNTATQLAIIAFNGQNNITGWTAANAGVRLPIKLNSRASLIPYIGVNMPLGSTASLGGVARAGGLPDTAYKSILVGGVTLSVRF